MATSKAEINGRFRSTLYFYLLMSDNKEKVIDIPTAEFIYRGLNFSEIRDAATESESETTFKVIGIPDADDALGLFTFEFADSWLEYLRKQDDFLSDLRRLELLSQYVLRICKIYDAFVGDKENLQEDERLNTLYMALLIKLDKLLEDPHLTGLRSQKPKLHKSFIGRLDEISRDYSAEFRATLWQFYDATNSLSAETFAETGGLGIDSPIDHSVLEDVDSTLEKHKTLLSNSTPDHEATLPLAATPTAALKVDIHKLKPQHYKDSVGVLVLSATLDVEIAKHGEVKRPKSNEQYAQCWLLKLLFRSVNSLNNGITFSTFLGVKYDKNNPKHMSKIRNTVDEINSKVADKSGAKKLILARAGKIFVNTSYL